MKSVLSIVSVVLIALAFNSCIDDPIDSEKKTYTIEGRLYKGLGEEPWPNANLILEAWDQGANYLEGDEFFVVAEGITDYQGYFSLEYKQFTTESSDGGQMTLYANRKRIVENYPWNVNINRELSEKDHARIIVIVYDNRTDTQKDTLYIGGSQIGESHLIDGDVVPVSFINQDGINSRAYALTPLKDSTYIFRNDFSSRYNHSAFCQNLGYALNTQWFKDETKVQYVQSCWRGFPYTETIEINLK